MKAEIFHMKTHLAIKMNEFHALATHGEIRVVVDLLGTHALVIDMNAASTESFAGWVGHGVLVGAVFGVMSQLRSCLACDFHMNIFT